MIVIHTCLDQTYDQVSNVFFKTNYLLPSMAPNYLFQNISLIISEEYTLLLQSVHQNLMKVGYHYNKVPIWSNQIRIWCSLIGILTWTKKKKFSQIQNLAELNKNFARSGIWLGQIRIPIWPSMIPDLAKFLFGLRHKYKVWHWLLLVIENIKRDRLWKKYYLLYIISDTVSIYLSIYLLPRVHLGKQFVWLEKF